MTGSAVFKSKCTRHVAEPTPTSPVRAFATTIDHVASARGADASTTATHSALRRVVLPQERWTFMPRILAGAAECGARRKRAQAPSAGTRVTSFAPDATAWPAATCTSRTVPETG